MIEIDTVAGLTALMRDTFPLAAQRDLERLVTLLCATEEAAQALGGSLRFQIDGWRAVGAPVTAPVTESILGPCLDEWSAGL